MSVSTSKCTTTFGKSYTLPQTCLFYDSPTCEAFSACGRSAMSITFLCNLVRGGKDYMDLKHAQALQAAWEKLGNASCPHSTLKLVKTAGGYFTGEYGCTTCGKTFEVPHSESNKLG